MKTLLLAVLLFATPALAHDGHLKPMYGGITAEADLFQVELVWKGAAATLHITEHGSPIETSNAKGKLTVLAGTAKEEIALTPNGYQSLGGKLKTKPGKGAKLVAVIEIPGKGVGTARFSLK